MIQTPYYKLYRTVLANDSLPKTVKDSFENSAGYRFANIQIVPSGGDNPTVQVLWWSEDGTKFIQEHTPISKAGLGANTSYEFTIECLGRLFFVAVTSGGGVGATKIYISGDELRPQ